MKKPWYYAFVFVATLPVDLLCWAVVLVVHAFVGKRLFWKDGLWSELKHKPRSFLGLNIGNGGFLERGYCCKTLHHEIIHCRQFQAASITGFLSSITVCIIHAWTFGPSSDCLFILGVWPIVGILHGVGCWLQSILSGGDWYTDSLHEQSARAISSGQQCCHLGNSSCKK